MLSQKLLYLVQQLIFSRWSQEWPQIPALYWQQQRQEFIEQGRRQRPSAPPLTFADVTVAEPVEQTGHMTTSAHSPSG